MAFSLHQWLPNLLLWPFQSQDREMWAPSVTTTRPVWAPISRPPWQHFLVPSRWSCWNWIQTPKASARQCPDGHWSRFHPRNGNQWYDLLQDPRLFPWRCLGKSLQPIQSRSWSHRPPPHVWSILLLDPDQSSPAPHGRRWHQHTRRSKAKLRTTRHPPRCYEQPQGDCDHFGLHWSSKGLPTCPEDAGPQKGSVDPNSVMSVPKKKPGW